MFAEAKEARCGGLLTKLTYLVRLYTKNKTLYREKSSPFKEYTYLGRQFGRNVELGHQLDALYSTHLYYNSCG